MVGRFANLLIAKMFNCNYSQNTQLFLTAKRRNKQGFNYNGAVYNIITI